MQLKVRPVAVIFQMAHVICHLRVALLCVGFKGWGDGGQPVVGRLLLKSGAVAPIRPGCGVLAVTLGGLGASCVAGLDTGPRPSRVSGEVPGNATARKGPVVGEPDCCHQGLSEPRSSRFCGGN